MRGLRAMEGAQIICFVRKVTLSAVIDVGVLTRDDSALEDRRVYRRDTTNQFPLFHSYEFSPSVYKYATSRHRPAGTPCIKILTVEEMTSYADRTRISDSLLI